MAVPESGYRDESLPCSDGRGWENLCRALADKRSRQEEELDWNLPADAPLPYRYRWEHVKDVVENARFLTRRLGADEDVCVAAAWLHDIRKLEDQHGRRGAAEAVQVLKATDFPQHKIGTVDTAIRLHEGFSSGRRNKPLEPLEAAILWDADKLTKLGVPQLAHILGTARAMHLSQTERLELAESYTLEFVARTAESMNTEPALRVARMRYREMVAFVQTWRRQVENPFGEPDGSDPWVPASSRTPA